MQEAQTFALKGEPMLFTAIGAIIGAIVSVRYTFGLFFDDLSYQETSRFYQTVAIIMFIIVVAVAAFLCGCIGWFISFLIGLLLPKRHSDSTYKVGSFKKETHVQPIVVSTGESTTVIPRIYTTYEYSYFDEESGRYQHGSLDTSSATVYLTNDRHASLEVRRYWFPIKWWNWIASPSSTDFTFKVPRGTEV